MDPIIHLDFEKIVTLKERKFPGMVHDDFGEKLIGDTIQCAESNIEMMHLDRSDVSSFNLTCLLPQTYHLIISYLLFKAIPLSFSTRDDKDVDERFSMMGLLEGLVRSHNIIKSC